LPDEGEVRRLLVTIVVVRVFAGCARPSSGVYLQAWDGEATQWEVPPARTVLAPEAGSGTGGSTPGGGGVIGGGGSASDLPVCTKQDQLRCCYDDQAGHPSGIPKCGWQRLVPGASVAITALYDKDDKKVTAPVGLQLTSASPGAFATLDECKSSRVGFILSGPGVEDRALTSTIRNYAVRADGSWVYQGGGATIGLIAGRDTQATDDGGMTSPSEQVGEGLCKALTDHDYKASVEFFDGIDFTIGGEDYHAKFATSPNGSATGYYVQIQRNF
jgi:hypothetical protein